MSYNSAEINEFSDIWVFCEQRDGKLMNTDFELVSEGRKLADERGSKLVGILLGGEGIENTAKELGGYGADKVIGCADKNLAVYTTDAYSKVLCDVVMEKKPEVLLIGASNIGRDLGPRVAARLHTGLTADATHLDIDMDRYVQFLKESSTIDLEKVKMLDITRKNKNLIPTVESHKAVLVFTEAGIDDIFYRMWNAGLGDCDVWYNEGSEPAGEIKHDKVSNMINRGINASAGMLIVNEHARNTYKIGMDNHNFKRGSIHYVGSEIRSVILNKMHVGRQDDICVISGESIAVEAAIIATEGTVIAVEYNKDVRPWKRTLTILACTTFR